MQKNRTLPAALAATAALVAAPGASAAIQFDLFTGTPTAQSLIIDSNQCPAQGPIAMYVAGTVTNTGGTAVNSVQATISGLSGSFALTGAQSATISIGTLAAGAAAVAGWHVAYPCTDGASIGVSINASGAVGSDTDAVTLTVREAQSANAGGNVLSTTLGPGAVVGQTITADVQYDFGNINTGNEFFLQPAGNTDFDAACLRLVAAEIMASNIDAIPVGTANDLYFVSPNKQTGNGYTTTVRYSFRYLCAGVSTLARPYAVQTSGASNIKYTGNYDGGGSLNFSFPGATNPFTISKSVSPGSLLLGAAPHTATYTVTLANPSAFDTLIDAFADDLPVGVSFEALDAVSGVTAANSGAIPANGATGALAFTGISGSSYALAAGGTLSLVYTASVRDVAGSYQNTASASVGTATIGPATATVTVAAAELSVAKTVAVYDPGAAGLFAVPGNEVVYTIRVENTGVFTADSDSLVVVDEMPAELAFYNGDFAPGAPVSPFEFDPGASGLSCCAAADIQYSNSPAPPAAYGYTPAAGYDADVNFIKLNPKGELAPGEAFEVRFRARIE